MSTISTRLAIEGEAEYRNSIKNINNELKTLQSELGKTEAEYQSNSQSMEALSAKSEVLQDIYEKQTQKVEELQAALDNATTQHEAYGEAMERNKEDIANAEEQLERLRNSSEDTASAEAELQAQLDELNQQLANNESAYEKSGNAVELWQQKLNYAQTDLYNTQAQIEANAAAMDKTSESASSASDVTGMFSGALGQAGTAGSLMGSLLQGASAGGMMAFVQAGVQVAEVAIEFAMSFDEARSIIVEATGASGEALQAMTDSMMEVYKQIDETDVTQVGAAIGELATRLDLSGEELTRVTKLFEDYADVTGVDVKGAVADVSKVMKNWNVDIGGTEALLDKLVYAGQMSGISVESLSQTLTTNKAQLQLMGLSLDESIGLLAMMEKEGLNSSQVMMGFRQALKNFSDEGINAKDGLQDLIYQIQSATSETEAINIATEYFGTRASQEMVIAIRDGRFEWESYTEAVMNANGALTETEALADTFAEQWDNYWKGIGLSFGDLFQGNFDTVLEDGLLLTGYYDEYLAMMEADTEDFRSANVKMGDTISSVTEGIADHISTLNERYATAYANARTSIDGQISLFQEMDSTVDKSVSDLIGALDSEIAYMDEYSANLKRAIELGVDEGLIKKLSDGSEESAKILKAIAEDGGEHIEELNEKLGKVEKGKDNFAKQIAEQQTNFDAEMGKIEDRMDEMLKNLNDPETAKEAGAQTINGYIQGVTSKLDEVFRAYKQVCETGQRATKQFNKINSPSKVYEEFGNYNIEGLVEGTTKNAYKIEEAYEKVAKDSQDSLSRLFGKLDYSELMAPSPVTNYNDAGYTDNRNMNVRIEVASASRDDMQKVYEFISKNFATKAGIR